MPPLSREVAARALHVAEDVTELMGSTPMLHLHRVVPPGAADIYVKLEFFNPGGSSSARRRSTSPAARRAVTFIYIHKTCIQ